MNLNDPFGRLGQREANQYAAFRATLQEADITSLEAATKCREGLLKKFAIVTAIVALGYLLITLLFPASSRIYALFALIFVVWLLITMMRARRMISRYIREELAPAKD